MDAVRPSGHKHSITWFLIIWIPLLLALYSVLWLLYRAEFDARQTINLADEQNSIQMAGQTIGGKLDLLASDVLYLSQQSSLKEWIVTGSSDAKKKLAADLVAFVEQRKIYDQARLLDNTGQEILRINWNGGQPALVDDLNLQNKGSRYYFQDTIALGKGSVFLSSFDLNIEQQMIETPLKPVIRVATPVVDQTGHTYGIIVLNYLGQRLLERLRSIGYQQGPGIWLLNSDGYWLLGSQPEKEWGFMFPEREQMRFGAEHGQVWEAMQAGKMGSQLINNDGLYTYARVEPEIGPSVGETKPWYLVSYISSSTLAGNMAEQLQNYLLVAAVLTIVSAFGCGVVAQHSQLRQQSETRIRESEARFRGLLDSAPDAIITVDQQGVIQLVNEQTEKWFGYARNELIGQAIETLIPSRLREKHVGYRDGYFEAPASRPMGARNELFGLRKDGGEFPVEISLSPLQTSSGLLVTSIVRDVTARKQAEQLKQQVQARYQELVHNLPVGVLRYVPSGNGHFLEVNPAMVKIFESETNDALLKCDVVTLFADHALYEQFNEKIIQQGDVSGEELYLKTLAGRSFHATVTAIAKQDANGVTYVDGIVEDISARKESEKFIKKLNDTLRARSNELEAMNRELEAFSYSVSHDLRAPLRAMDGFSRTLLSEYSDRLDERGRDRLNRVRAASQHMAALIDDILKLSRVTRTELVREPVDLSILANEVAEKLANDDPSRNVTFSIQPGLAIEGDARLLRVALDNLLGNAWKFTGQRSSGLIEVGREIGEQGAAYFVRDNGAGFDMNYAEKLFGAFQRLHDSSEFPGTGIGLATVQRIIQKHGGRIWAESAIDQGATFNFTLDAKGNV